MALTSDACGFASERGKAILMCASLAFVKDQNLGPFWNPSW